MSPSGHFLKYALIDSVCLIYSFFYSFISPIPMLDVMHTMSLISVNVVYMFYNVMRRLLCARRTSQSSLLKSNEACSTSCARVRPVSAVSVLMHSLPSVSTLARKPVLLPLYR